MALVNETAAAAQDDTYSENEIVNAITGFFGVTAKAAAGIVDHVFADLGRPNAYIAAKKAPARSASACAMARA